METGLNDTRKADKTESLNIKQMIFHKDAIFVVGHVLFFF